MSNYEGSPRQDAVREAIDGLQDDLNNQGITLVCVLVAPDPMESERDLYWDETLSREGRILEARGLIRCEQKPQEQHDEITRDQQMSEEKEPTREERDQAAGRSLTEAHQAKLHREYSERRDETQAQKFLVVVVRGRTLTDLDTLVFIVPAEDYDDACDRAKKEAIQIDASTKIRTVEARALNRVLSSPLYSVKGPQKKEDPQ